MTTKSERLNMRISASALQKLKLASGLREQDLTSFVLGSALQQADRVILSERLVGITEAEFEKLEHIIANENPTDALVELMRPKARTAS
jgi:uncharacterized protein (DUF1778 family)